MDQAASAISTEAPGNNAGNAGNTITQQPPPQAATQQPPPAVTQNAAPKVVSITDMLAAHKNVGTTAVDNTVPAATNNTTTTTTTTTNTVPKNPLSKIFSPQPPPPPVNNATSAGANVTNPAAPSTNATTETPAPAGLTEINLSPYDKDGRLRFIDTSNPVVNELATFYNAPATEISLLPERLRNSMQEVTAEYVSSVNNYNELAKRSLEIEKENGDLKSVVQEAEEMKKQLDQGAQQIMEFLEQEVFAKRRAQAATYGAQLSFPTTVDQALYMLANDLKVVEQKNAELQAKLDLKERHEQMRNRFRSDIGNAHQLQTPPPSPQVQQQQPPMPRSRGSMVDTIHSHYQSMMPTNSRSNHPAAIRPQAQAIAAGGGERRIGNSDPSVATPQNYFSNDQFENNDDPEAQRIYAAMHGEMSTDRVRHKVDLEVTDGLKDPNAFKRIKLTAL